MTRKRSLRQLLGCCFGIAPVDAGGVAVPFDSMPIARAGWRAVCWDGTHGLVLGVDCTADGETIRVERDGDGYVLDKPRDCWALVLRVPRLQVAK